MCGMYGPCLFDKTFRFTGASVSLSNRKEKFLIHLRRTTKFRKLIVTLQR